MGGRVLVVQHQEDAPVAWVGKWLVEAGCRLDVRRPDLGEGLPETLRDHDAFVILGGSMMADDDEDCPWLPPTKSLVRHAAEEGVPTLGICLGHQIVAVALGGEAGPNPRGQQLGLIPMGWTEDAAADALTRYLTDATLGLHWNDHIVLREPPGTVALARTEHGELQAARFAPTVWGLQVHPEVDEHVLAGWAEHEPDRYADGVLDGVLDEVARAHEQLLTGWRPLATALSGMRRRVP